MTKKLTFCSLMAVFGILSLVLANIVQTNTIFLYLFSTLFTYICVNEYGIKYGILTYAVITLGGFILATNKISMIVYALIVGYYPILKHIVEHFNLAQFVKWLIKILFILTASAISYIVLKDALTLSIPIGAVFAFGVIIFVIYDVVLNMGIKFYALRLRKLR